MTLHFAPITASKPDPREEHFAIPSSHDGLSLFLRYLAPECEVASTKKAALYVHGGTFPSALSIARRLDGHSRRDELALDTMPRRSSMFAVICVVQPKAGLTDQYLDIAKVLKTELEKIDGFINNERLRSQRNKSRVLSLSTWPDEKAVIRWRTLAIHHAIQEKGRFEVFEHDHLQVGEITADTHVPEGQSLRDLRLDETEIGEAKVATVSELSLAVDGRPPASGIDSGLPEIGPGGLVNREVFNRIYNPGKQPFLACWQNRTAADRWKPHAAAYHKLQHRRVRVIRNYGMADRREAPQYYPPVQPAGQSR